MAYLKNLGKLEYIEELGDRLSEGNLRKWRALSSSGVIYIKAASNRYGYECETECLCSRLAILLGLRNVVVYDMDYLYINNKKIKVCVSKDFTRGSIYLTVNELLPNVTNLSGNLKYQYVCSIIRKDILDSILLFDAVILNSDRHLRNLGLIEEVVPLFDFGSSLFSTKTCKYIRQILKTNLNYQTCKPFFNNYNKQLRLIGRTNLVCVRKEDVYKLVNAYFNGERSKLLCKVLITRLRTFGLLVQ